MVLWVTNLDEPNPSVPLVQHKVLVWIGLGVVVVVPELGVERLLLIVHWAIHFAIIVIRTDVIGLSRKPESRKDIQAGLRLDGYRFDKEMLKMNKNKKRVTV